jgi:hypothetical protein
MSSGYPLPGQPSVSFVPPYNATNFTTANPNVYSTLQTYGYSQPQYPLDTGSNSYQVSQQQQNITYFSYVQQKAQNGSPPVFKTQAERLMYIQGQYATASRNLITGQNTSGPAGVPFYMPPGPPILISVVPISDGEENSIIVTFAPPIMCSVPNQSAEINNLTYIIYVTNTSTQITTSYSNVSSPYTISVSSGTYQVSVAAQFPPGQVGNLSNVITVTVP